MTKDRINKAFGWLTTVEVDLIAKSMDAGAVQYVKASDKISLINEFRDYVFNVIAENLFLKTRNARLSASNTSLEFEVIELKKEREKLLKRIKELN